MKLAIVVGVASTLIAWNVHSAHAAEIGLPAIGTNVNFDYFLGTPKLNVGSNVPSERLIHSELTFAEGKHLHVAFQPGVPTVQIDLEFTAPNLVNLFEPDVFSFDETIALSNDNGVYGAPLRNDGVGYYTDNPDIYSFSWSFSPAADFSFYGLQWNISPDLKSGAVLPDYVDIAIDFFASGQVLVVPEPLSIYSALFAVCVAILTVRARRRVVVVGQAVPDRGPILDRIKTVAIPKKYWVLSQK